MDANELDGVDRGILYILQQNARSNTTADIGERVGVSSSTVANRIKKLEERGVIVNYHPTIDYELAGLDHHLLAIGTVPLAEQATRVEDIMEVPGVVSVRELMTSRQNVSIELVGHTQREIRRSLVDLHAAGVDTERFEIMERERVQPYNHFGEEQASDRGG